MGLLYKLFDLLDRKRSKTYIDEQGYKRFKDSGIPVHRWMAAKKLKRKLRPGEVVHHKNRNKKDNRLSNIFVFNSQKDHDFAHKKDAKQFGKKASYKGFKK